jgi:hypothetical protein
MKLSSLSQDDQKNDPLANIPKGTSLAFDQQKHKQMSVADIIKLVEGPLLKSFLAGDDIGSADLLKTIAALQGLSVISVGTALTSGRGKKRHKEGLGLWRSNRNKFRACRENVGLIARAAREAGRLDALLQSHGFANLDELIAAGDKLPSAT